MRQGRSRTATFRFFLCPFGSIALVSRYSEHWARQKKIGKKKNGKGKTVRSSSSKKREATTVGGGIERDKKKRKKRKLLRHWEGGEEKKWTCGWTAESWRKISPVNVNLATVLITGAHLRTKDLPRVDANGRGRAVDTADWWHSYEKKKFLVESKQNLLTKMGT